MFITQNETRPGEIQNALYDLMRNGVNEVRVCSAYISMSGSELLFNGICRSATNGDHDQVHKTIVTSLDFGLTDPAALQFWSEMQNCSVLVAGVSLLERGHLLPQSAFHSKLYVIDQPEGRVGSLVGSANLTNRGLTINSEVAWCEEDPGQAGLTNAAWNNVIQGTVSLTPEILDQYRELRQRIPRERTTEELEPVPEPAIGRLTNYIPFGEAEVNPEGFSQMWIQSHRLQGGACTQLELPRGTHRFFGATYQDYEIDRVDHIAEPVLISGCRIWQDRSLTWHSSNAMERINLPSRAMGGFEYENSLILFRRIALNTYELRVHQWDSDTARSYIEASRRQELVFRVGRSSNRLAGFLP